MDRTNSMGLWTHSNGFYHAACVLVRPENAGFLDATYYLVSHSIEVALKAFLRGNGVSLEDLKNPKKLGHDLEKILDKAVLMRLETYVGISQKDTFAIQAINEFYRGKELEYIVTGYKSYPKIELLMSFAHNVLNGIRQFCFENMSKNVPTPDNQPLEPSR